MYALCLTQVNVVQTLLENIWYLNFHMFYLFVCFFVFAMKYMYGGLFFIPTFPPLHTKKKGSK